MKSQLFPCRKEDDLITKLSLSIGYYWMNDQDILMRPLMESLKKLVEKIETPLAFASEDCYQHLPQIKNLEKLMTTLLCRLKKEIFKEEQGLPKGRFNILCDALLDLFAGYEALTQKQKIHRLSQAKTLLNELKAGLISSMKALPDSTLSVGPDQNPEPLNILSRPVRFIQGVGPRISALLARKNLITILDLLYFIPRRYEDRRKIFKIAETVPGVRQMVVGRIINTETRFYGRHRIFEVSVDDGSGRMKAKWFKGRLGFLKSAFRLGSRLILAGEVGGFPFEREMIHPDFEILNDQDDQLLHFKRIIPVYSETEGLHQKTLRRIQWKVVRDYAHLIESSIPRQICRKRELMGINDAVRQVHFPGNDQEIQMFQEGRSHAHRRLIYDEFFFFQVGMALKKRGEVIERGIRFNTNGTMVRKFYSLLSYTLTPSQRRVISEIEKDMASVRCMSRLLQGDVGSGKTVVAMTAMITACENGHQAAIMAPTEILAEQHYRNLKNWSEQLGIRMDLLTGGMRPSHKAMILDKIQNGGTDLVVGTHALIQERVSFRSLGLVVIDEQHRFGVVQRAELRKKGPAPDVLVMTATPIPRTLAMTVYGDLDVSVIDEMPPGKKPVLTKIFSESQRLRVYEIIRREMNRGHQIFIVYPLVEASENLDLKDATRMAEHLAKEIFPGYLVGLVHGRMKEKEKDQIMADFTAKKIQILVSTTVIEVGIDIPEASLMVVEHAERFGLSQLHQLRGRVGRGTVPSFCILLIQKTGSVNAHKRLRMMEQCHDGFQIAEEDLAIRGPGEFMGTRQSGLPDFKIASIVRDGRILSEAREDAFALVENDSHLTKPEHQELREVLLCRWGNRLELARTG